MPKSLFNYDAEQSLISCILLDKGKGEISEDIFSKIKFSDFYSETLQILFNTTKSLFNKSVEIDLVTLSEVLERTGMLAKAGGLETLTKLTTLIPSNANYQHYMSIILDYSKLREIERIAQDLQSIVREGKKADIIQKELEDKVASLQERELDRPCVHIKETAESELKRIELAMQGKYDEFGLATGFQRLDKTLWGLQKGNLVIAAARPGMGKTAFALNIIDHVANNLNKKIAFFSLEMSRVEITRRLYSLMADIDNYDIKKGNGLGSRKSDIEKAFKKLVAGGLHIDDSQTTVAEMSLKAKRLQRKEGLDLIVVDYLQYIKPTKRNGNRFQEVGEIARDLKTMARELNVPVIALCQLSRRLDTTEDTPTLSDLRESGEIENNADIIMFLYMSAGTKFDEIRNMELQIGKNRNGVMKTFKIEFEGAKFKFREKDDSKMSQEKMLTPISQEGLPF